MQNRDTFSGYHPLVNFLYFTLVIVFSMFFMHPVCLAVSLLSAVGYYVQLNGKKSIAPLTRYALPMLFLPAVINPAFNHQGTIILRFLPSDNPLTLESILYGIATGVMLVSVLIWFGCYNCVITSDKFCYLFGRLIPSLSLVISMILRFIPQFKTQLENVKEAQAGIGNDIAQGSILKRLKNSISCFSIMVTWSLENAVDTADSMKSRGYGLKGRTAFSIYSFADKDRYVLLWLCFCGVYLISGSISGNLRWLYFPSLSGAPAKALTVSFFIIYFAMCITPVVINCREERKWKSFQSKI